MCSESKRKVSSRLKRQRKEPICNSIVEIFPREILLNIMVRVASSSLVDLCNMKQSCKELRNLGSDDLVFRHATLKKIRMNRYGKQSPWRQPPELTSFLVCCEESGNPESLYKHGMVEYFEGTRPLLGCRLLKKAANLGHEEANYVLGIILLCMDDESIRHGMSLLEEPDMESSIGEEPILQGLSLLKELEAKIGRFELGKVRGRCKKAFLELGQTKPLCQQQSICSDPKCRLIKEITFCKQVNKYIFYCHQCTSDLLDRSTTLVKPIHEKTTACLNPRCGVAMTSTHNIICGMCKWDNEVTRFRQMQHSGYY